MDHPVTPASVGETDDAFAASVKKARAEIADGHVVPFEDVRRWLRSWGKPDELPPPRPQGSGANP